MTDTPGVKDSPARRLVRYWAHGEGAAKVGGWGTPGSYERGVALLSKYLPPEEVHGYVANIYHEATGTWPGAHHGLHKAAHSGAMVALFPDNPDLYVTGSGEPMTDLHVTLLYLGQADQISPEQRRQILTAVESVVDTYRLPGEATIAGVGMFSGDVDSGAPIPVVALIDMPDLAEFRTALKATVDGLTGGLVSDDHDFVPHMTLDYVDTEADALQVIANWEPPDPTIRLGRIVVCFGDVRYSLNIEGADTVAKAATAEQRFTLMPWYIPEKTDAHGEWTDAHEIQQGLWSLVRKDDRRLRLQHVPQIVAGEILEQVVWPYPVSLPMFKADGTSEVVDYPANTAFMGVQWEPWSWTLLKSGKITGLSMGGRAKRIKGAAPGAVAKSFEEAKHPRASDGRFGHVAGIHHHKLLGEALHAHNAKHGKPKHAPGHAKTVKSAKDVKPGDTLYLKNQEKGFEVHSVDHEAGVVHVKTGKSKTAVKVDSEAAKGHPYAVIHAEGTPEHLAQHFVGDPNAPKPPSAPEQSLPVSSSHMVHPGDMLWLSTSDKGWLFHGMSPDGKMIVSKPNGTGKQKIVAPENAKGKAYAVMPGPDKGKHLHAAVENAKAPEPEKTPAAPTKATAGDYVNSTGETFLTVHEDGTGTYTSGKGNEHAMSAADVSAMIQGGNWKPKAPEPAKPDTPAPQIDVEKTFPVGSKVFVGGQNPGIHDVIGHANGQVNTEAGSMSPNDLTPVPEHGLALVNPEVGLGLTVQPDGSASLYNIEGGGPGGLSQGSHLPGASTPGEIKSLMDDGGWQVGPAAWQAPGPGHVPSKPESQAATDLEAKVNHPYKQGDWVTLHGEKFYVAGNAPDGKVLIADSPTDQHAVGHWPENLAPAKPPAAPGKYVNADGDVLQVHEGGGGTLQYISGHSSSQDVNGHAVDILLSGENPFVPEGGSIDLTKPGKYTNGLVTLSVGQGGQHGFIQNHATGAETYLSANDLAIMQGHAHDTTDKPDNWHPWKAVGTNTGPDAQPVPGTSYKVGDFATAYGGKSSGTIKAYHENGGLKPFVSLSQGDGNVEMVNVDKLDATPVPSGTTASPAPAPVYFHSDGTVLKVNADGTGTLQFSGGSESQVGSDYVKGIAAGDVSAWSPGEAWTHKDGSVAYLSPDGQSGTATYKSGKTYTLGAKGVEKVKASPKWSAAPAGSAAPTAPAPAPSSGTPKFQTGPKGQALAHNTQVYSTQGSTIAPSANAPTKGGISGSTQHWARPGMVVGHTNPEYAGNTYEVMGHDDATGTSVIGTAAGTKFDAKQTDLAPLGPGHKVKTPNGEKTIADIVNGEAKFTDGTSEPMGSIKPATAITGKGAAAGVSTSSKKIDYQAPIPSTPAAYGSVPLSHADGARTFTSNADGVHWGESWWADWRNSLTKPQQQALANYTGSGYHSWNGGLRKGEKPSTSMQHAIDALNSTELPEAAILSRGIGVTLTPDMEGSVFYDRGFQSTSAAPNAAFSGMTTILRIHAPAGTKGAYLGQGAHSSFDNHEMELLLPPGAAYRIDKVTQTNGKVYADVTLVAQGLDVDYMQTTLKALGLTRIWTVGGWVS